MKKNNQNPLVSIIMNSHNGSKFIDRSIRTILFQTYKNWELIFWDNSSKDNTKKLLKSFKDSRIKYFYTKKFNSLYKSRNLAINKARGKYICFLDVDDEWKKNKIFLQVKKIEKLKNNFIFSNYYIKDKLHNKKYLKKKSPLPEGKITQQVLDDYFLGILTVMINRKVFRNYKFNSNYNVIGDFDLFIKLSQKLNFSCIQKPLSTYVIHGSNFSIKNLDIYIKEISKWLSLNKNKLEKKYNLFNLKYYILKLKLKKIFFHFKNFYLKGV